MPAWAGLVLLRFGHYDECVIHTKPPGKRRVAWRRLREAASAPTKSVMID